MKEARRSSCQAAACERAMDKFDKLQDLLRQLVRVEFTGSVTINFSQGGIGRIEKLEEIRIKT